MDRGGSGDHRGKGVAAHPRGLTEIPVNSDFAAGDRKTGRRLRDARERAGEGLRPLGPCHEERYYGVCGPGVEESEPSREADLGPPPCRKSNNKGGMEDPQQDDNIGQTGPQE